MVIVTLQPHLATSNDDKTDLIKHEDHNTKLRCLLEDGTLFRWTLIPGRPPDTPICSSYHDLQAKLAVMVRAPHICTAIARRAQTDFVDLPVASRTPSCGKLGVSS